ncbi:MAG: sugar ABC transporter substrate-binding protein [Cyanobacteria bacterium J06639_1]
MPDPSFSSDHHRLSRSHVLWVGTAMSVALGVSGCGLNPSSPSEPQSGNAASSAQSDAPADPLDPSGGSSNSSQPDRESAETGTATAIPDLNGLRVTQTWRIALVLKSRTDPYWQQVQAGAEATANTYGVDLNIVGSDRPQTAAFVEEQIVAIAELLEGDDLDGLLIGPADSLRLVPIVERAIDSGIPVIAIDTPLNSDRLLASVGFDNYAAGQALGAWVVRELDGSGNVLILDGPPHHDNAIERREGFLAGLSAGQIDVLGIESAHWDAERAAAVTAQWLQEFEDVDAIVAANDSMALGAIRAVQDAKRTDIVITGFDGLADGLAAVRAGTLAATIDQQPAAQAKLGLQLLLNHLETEATYPEFIPLQTRSPISADTLDGGMSDAGVSFEAAGSRHAFSPADAAIAHSATLARAGASSCQPLLSVAGRPLAACP